ncbi:MAG: hypothetical protein ACE149_06265 [Armatimonadota bacterium]
MYDWAQPLVLVGAAIWLAATGASADAARPPWMPVAPALPVVGRTVHVSTVTQLQEAIAQARDGDTVLLADGVYQLDRFIQLRGLTGVTLRGASGDASKVELRGIGWDSDERDDILRIQACTDITVAYLTFAECRAYGIKLEQTPWEGRQLKDIRIHACDFRNIGTRAIKGTGGGGGFVDGGSIRYCNFENTKVPPNTWLYDGDYISAIDCMRLRGWQIADNYFHNIRGANGGGRGAIFVWVESRDVVAERNVFVNCDRSIAYGNPSASTERGAQPHMTGGIIRNNFVVSGADTGIELSWVKDVLVCHNTVLAGSADGSAIHYHWREISGVEVIGNIVRGRIHGDEGGVSRSDNLTEGIQDCWFSDAAAGDLHLTPDAQLGEVPRLGRCPTDFDSKPRQDPTTPGADEPPRAAAGALPYDSCRGSGP